LLLLGLRIGIEEIVEDVFQSFDLIDGSFLLLFTCSFVFFDS